MKNMKVMKVSTLVSVSQVFIAGFGILILMNACGDGKKEVAVDNKFCISDTMMKNTKIDTVKLEELENEIRLSGKITFDESKVIKVFPLASGNIHDIKVELGDYVNKGQALACIHSSDIAELEKEMDVATSNLSIAEKNMEVAHDLYKSGYGTEREYITSQKEYQKVKSEITRINEVLNLFGRSDKKSDYVIKSPISGFVVEKNANNDMQIRSDYSENLFTISDLQNVWVMANVYESDIPNIKTGYDVVVTTLSYPDKIYKGKIDKIFNVLDPVERVMKVRVKLDNPDYVLKPEMYARISVNFKEEGNKKYVAIPSSSVIFDDNKNYVMIYNDKCNIETREISILKSGQLKTYVQSGLKPGERVISKSQLYVYDALND